MMTRFIATTYLLLSILSNALAVESLAPSKSSQPEFCNLDGKRAVQYANHNGYKFTLLNSQGNPTCTVDSNGEIFVVSANTMSDATCSFAIFVPPNNKNYQPIERVAIKSKQDSSIQFIQKSSNYKVGFSIVLTAKKNYTSQFRVTHVELMPVNGKCDENQIGAQI